MVFLTLHPFNLIVALLARLRGPVAYWRDEGLPAWLLGPFEVLEASDFSNSAAWNGLLQDAHAALAPQITQAPSIRISAHGVTANAGQLWLQWFAMQFEADFLGQHLAAGWASARGLRDCRMAQSGVLRWARAAGVAPATLAGVHRVPGSAFADSLWEMAKSLRAVLLALWRCAFSTAPVHLRGHRFRYLFNGVAASRRPYALDQIDFSFLARRQLLPTSECLYATYGPLIGKRAEALAETGASAIPVADLAALLPFRARARLALDLIGCLAKFFQCKGGAGDALTGLLAGSLATFAASRHVGVEVVVAGLDGGPLEWMAVPLLSAAGVRTILWQHALVGFAHAPDAGSFRNKVLEQSAFAAATVCVWTPADREMLNQRALIPAADGPLIRVTGPLMSGDSRWLQRNGADARRAIGLDIRPGRALAVAFDLPTFADGVLRKHRIAMNRIPKPVHDAFYADLADVLRAFPEIDIALKPKRHASERQFHVGPAFRALVDPEGEWLRTGRVHLVDVDIDPYLPISAADMCIGMPFTSPIVAALNAGKPALWYDPHGLVTFPYPPELQQVLVRGREQLHARLTAWRSATAPAAPASLLAGIADPGGEFAAILAGAQEDDALVRPSSH